VNFSSMKMRVAVAVGAAGTISALAAVVVPGTLGSRSEEHTSELQSHA